MTALRYSAYVKPDGLFEDRWPTVTIRACYIDEARAILNKLADRAESYGQIITWQEEFGEREVVRVRWDGERISVKEKWVSLFVDGAAPKIGNHKFVAMLERMKGGTIVRTIPDVELGDFGRDWDGECAHCGSKRDRVHGYVIEDENGMTIVGKSCVRDYLGMDNPQRMLGVLRDITDLSNMGEDEEGGLGYSPWTTAVWGVVAAARAAVGMFGYGKKDMGVMSTIGLVRSLSGKGRKTPEQESLLREFNTRGEHYYSEAWKVIEWARAQENPKSDYLHNLKVILGSDYIRDKDMGLAVSAVVAYDNEMARLRRIEDAKNNHVASTGYVGVLKTRMEAEVTIERIITVNNQWGNYRIFLFRTTDGAVLKWTTSTETDTRLGDRPANANDRVKLSFNPQKHELYQGEPQTTVNRCKMLAV